MLKKTGYPLKIVEISGLVSLIFGCKILLSVGSLSVGSLTHLSMGPSRLSTKDMARILMDDSELQFF